MIKDEKVLVEVTDVIRLIHNRATVEDLEPLMDDLKRLPWYRYLKTDKGYIFTDFITKEDTK